MAAGVIADAVKSRGRSRDGHLPGDASDLGEVERPAVVAGRMAAVHKFLPFNIWNTLLDAASCLSFWLTTAAKWIASGGNTSREGPFPLAFP